MNTNFLCVAALIGAATASHAQPVPQPAASAAATAATPAPSPAATAAKVSKALENTQGVPAGDISVTTHAATVVLSGEVNSEAERAAAQAAAETAAGSTRVSSNIQVRPLEDRPLKEQQAAQQSVQLVRDVQSALQSDARTANLGIAVTTVDGKTVVLQGLVPGHAQSNAAQGVAAAVTGVMKVDNRLILPGDPLEKPATLR